MIGKHSLQKYSHALTENWTAIQPEIYGTVTQDGREDYRVLEMPIMVFLFAFFLELFIWVFAVMYLIQHYNTLPPIARAIGIIGVSGTIPGGSLITLLAVYMSKK